MSRRTEQRQAITETLCAHLLANGLQQTSLRQLAKAAEVSDRMLLYYFEDKIDVMTCVMQAIAGAFTEFLNDAVPSRGHMTLAGVFEEVTQLSSAPDLQPFMSIWIEAIAAASRGTEPYKTAATDIASGFLDWIETRLPPTHDAPAKAAMLLTLIEGLAVMQACTSEEIQVTAGLSIFEILKNAESKPSG